MAGARVYEIRIQGSLSSRWFDWFEGFRLVPLEDGQTLLRGPVVDQSALFGLLSHLHDLNLDLISVNRVEEGG